MQYRFVLKKGSTGLVVFFAGFAQGSLLLDGLECRHDLCLIYDYRDFNFDCSIFDDYRHIDVIGWSLGVFVSAWLLHDRDNVTFHTAINGTVRAIDEKEGIDPALYMATHDNLTDRTFEKFLLRICGTRANLDGYRAYASGRDVSSLRNELMAIYNIYAQKTKAACLNTVFKNAYVGSRDRIFSKENQLAHLAGSNCNIIETDSYHYDRELFINALEGIIR